MSVTRKISLAFVAAALAFGTLGAPSQANAGSLSKKEAAILAGAGGFFLGAIIASQHHGHAHGLNSWERHVHRCYARYASYNEHTDTYFSYSGYEKRCRL